MHRYATNICKICRKYQKKVYQKSAKKCRIMPILMDSLPACKSHDIKNLKT